MVKSGSFKVSQGSTLGRIGSGVGKGLSEQLPKEIERGRLAQGLEELGNQKNQTPFQQFAGLASLPGASPQIIQSGTDLLRQQAIINGLNQGKNQISPENLSNKNRIQIPGLSSATTKESTESALNPYIPPSGAEQEQYARQLMASEPQIYPNIDAARSAVQNQITANVNQSNALLQKRGLEEDVQSKAENALREEIKTLGANIPGTLSSKLQQKAVDDVRKGKLSVDEAKVKVGQIAHEASQDFSNIRSWGNLGLITKNSKDLISSINALQGKAKKGGYQKEAAESLVADNGLTPSFAYATMYPVNQIKPLNKELKDLPDIKPKFNKVIGSPGLAGVGFGRPKNEDSPRLTSEISPSLAKSMGFEGSPLAISYELEKKGYDPQVWKDYLLENQKELNLTTSQIDELQKPGPSFFGQLNDWWLKSFSGVK